MQILQTDQVSCLAHVLNTAVQTALRPHTAMIAQARDLVVAVRRSPLHSEKLSEIATVLNKQNKECDKGVGPVKLVLDVQTRWNSTFLMLVILLFPTSCSCFCAVVTLHL